MLFGSTRLHAAALPETAEAALLKLYPGADIGSTSLESDANVAYYLVSFEHKKKKLMIEITEKGEVRELKTPVEWGTLPAAVKTAAKEGMGRGKIHQAYRVERRGSTRSGAFVKVVPAEVYYEIDYRLHSRIRELFYYKDGKAVTDRMYDRIGESKAGGKESTPAARMKASASREKRAEEGEETVPLKDLAPAIVRAATEKVKGVKVTSARIVTEDDEFFFELKGALGPNRYDFRVDGSGKVIAMEKAIPLNKLPKAVTEALKRDFTFGKLDSAEVVEKGGAKTYKVSLLTRGERIEVVLTPAGVILSQKAY
jgi:hypothetical protein